MHRGVATGTFIERVARNVFLPYKLRKEHISGSRISTTLSSATCNCGHAIILDVKKGYSVWFNLMERA